MRTWNGDSRGPWKGNSLVVDTTNFSSKSAYQGAAEDLRVVERFTRVDANTINYDVAFSDSTTWVKNTSYSLRSLR